MRFGQAFRDRYQTPIPHSNPNQSNWQAARNTSTSKIGWFGVAESGDKQNFSARSMGLLAVVFDEVN
jgi:hypothetical protein